MNEKLEDEKTQLFEQLHLLLQQNQMKSKAARSKTSQRLRRGKRQQRRLRQV